MATFSTNGGSSYAYPIGYVRPIARPIVLTVEGAPIVSSGIAPSPTDSPSPLSVTDAGSGGGAMTGISDLFSGFGSSFADLTHPGTSANAPSSDGVATVSGSNGMIFLGIGALVLLYFLTRK